MGAVSTLVHLVLGIHYAYGIYVYMYELNPPKEIRDARNSYGGQFKYLTFLNMLLQCGYFFLALLNDLIGSDTSDYKKSKKFQRMRDYIFTTVVFSVGMFVSVTFWGLWVINRDLIFPKIFDTFFPVWLNHNIHTTPAIGVLLEMFISPHASPNPRNGVLAVMSAISFYMMWICLIAFKSGNWVYPILEKLPVIGRAAFMVGMAILLYLFYVIGDKLNELIWGASKKRVKKSQ